MATMMSRRVSGSIEHGLVTDGAAGVMMMHTGSAGSRSTKTGAAAVVCVCVSRLLLASRCLSPDERRRGRRERLPVSAAAAVVA